jgi:ribonuclease HI
MELMAAIRALEEFEGPAEIEIRSDSQYLIKGMNAWIIRWKANRWKNSSRKLVENIHLWRQLDALSYGRRIT